MTRLSLEFMKTKLTTITGLITLILLSCQSKNEHQNETDKKSNDDGGDQSINIESTKETAKNKISIFKETVLNLIDSVKYNSKHYHFDSLTISGLDSLSNMSVVNELYENNIDSIEIYGLFGIRPTSEKEFYYMPNHSILILYFNNLSESENVFDNYIKKSWNRPNHHYKFEEIYFKSGGMSFMLDSNLVVYSFNVCGEGNQNKKVQEMDALIKDKVFESKPFERFISTCGSIRWVLKD